MSTELTLDLARGRVGRFLDWWTGSLGELFARYGKHDRAWSILVMYDSRGFALWQGDGEEIVATVAPGPVAAMPAIADESPAPHAGAQVLRLAPEMVLVKKIRLPAAARDVIQPVIANQVGKYAPWPVEDSVFGYRIPGEADANGQMTVEIAIAQKSKLEADIAQLAQRGFSPTRVDVAASPEVESAIALVDETEHRTGEMTHKVRRSLQVGALLFLLCTGLGGVRMVHNHLERASVDAQLAHVRGKMAAHGALFAENDKLKARIGAAIAQRKQTPATVVVLDRLSRILPDNTYLKSLQIDRDRFEISGIAQDSATLISLLEHAQGIRGAGFSAPTTRSGDGLERFTITGRAQPVANKETVQ